MVNLEMAEKYANDAEIALDAGDYKVAEENIDKAINLDFRNIDYHITKAHILNNQSKFNESLKVLNFAENLDKKDPVIYSLKSLCYGGMEDYQNSKIEAEKAIKIDPEYPFPYLNLGIALKFLGDIDNAIKVVKKYENMEPSDPDGHFELAEIYFQINEYKKAIQEINIVLRFDKSNMDAHDMKIRILFKQKDLKEYLKAIYNAFIVSYEFKYLIQTVDAFEVLGKYEAAINLLKIYINSGIDSVPAYMELAHIYIENNEDGLAFENYGKALLLDNSEKNQYDWFYFLLSYEKYDKLFEEIDKSGIDNNIVMEIKYEAFDNMGNHKEALDIAKELIKYDDDPHYAASYAKELRKLNRNDEAFDFLKKYIDKPETEYEKFLLLLQKKDIDPAMESLASVAKHVMEDDYIVEFLLIEGIFTLIGNSNLETVNDFLKKIEHYEERQNLLDILRGINYGVNCDYETGKKMIIEIQNKNKDLDICYYLDDFKDTEDKKCGEFIDKLIKEYCDNEDI